MKQFPKIAVFWAGMFLMCASAASLSAQENAVPGKAYVYCREPAICVWMFQA